MSTPLRGWLQCRYGSRIESVTELNCLVALAIPLRVISHRSPVCLPLDFSGNDTGVVPITAVLRFCAFAMREPVGRTVQEDVPPTMTHAQRERLIQYRRDELHRMPEMHPASREGLYRPPGQEAI